MNGVNDSQRGVRAACLVGILGAAGLAVWATTDFGMVRAYRRLLTVAQPGASSTPLTAAAARLPAAQRLVLEGDTTRSTPPEQQRAIWEAAPTNTARFHHYLTSVLTGYDTTGTNAAQRYSRLVADIRAGQKLDPDNARLDFVLAAKLLEQAVETKTSVTGLAPDGKARVRSEQVIKDRAKLEEAMRLLERGLTRPYYRRHVGDVLGERIAILGEPRSLSDQMLRLGLAADTSMPDLVLIRNLSRGAAAYAALLVGEGKAAEAEVFLGAWRPLTLAITRDSFALIDVLMAAAIVKEAELRIPDLYRQIGKSQAAEKMLKDTQAMTAPVLAWNARRTAFEQDPAARRERDAFVTHTGILASMLLPALTELPSAAELAPSRLLDYILIEDLFFSALSILMLAAMVAWVIGQFLGWKRDQSIERLSDGGLWLGAALRALWCVAVPAAVYLLTTRLVPLADRFYGLPYVWPKATLQIEALGVSMVVLACLTSPGRGQPAEGGARTRLMTVLVAGLLAVVVGMALCLPVSVLNAQHQTASLVAMAIPLAVAVGALVLRALEARSARQRPLTERRDNGFRATLALGLGILALTLGARGYLRVEEGRLVRQETVLTVVPAEGGFTVAEARLTRALRDLVLKAAK